MDELSALIFDFDGLILDTESTLVQAWQEIYAIYGLTIPIEEWAVMLGQSADPSMAYEYLEAHLGHAVDRVVLRQRRLRRERELLLDQAPMPGVEALIREVKGKGIKLAVASSSEHAWVDDHLARLDLLSLFDTVVCADDVEATKPAPDLYLRALEELMLTAKRAIALEDSEHGVHAARAAGLFCIAVPNAITKTASFAKAHVVLESLEGIHLDDILRMVSVGDG
jgi:HAD superfamily hydrolase (TIGR01509 family)